MARDKKGRFVKGEKPENAGNDSRVELVCKNCGIVFNAYKHFKRIYCGRVCMFKNKEYLSKIGWKKGRPSPQAGVSRVSMRGENNPRWIKDRTKLAKRQERNDMAYKEWRKQVWLRDNFKCKIANPDCAGRIEAHHILGWTDYPELRYQINNGITLCHFHHPRKRVEEKKLSPYFQELVAKMN